ncbi:hypothetical protein Bhyg_06570 [Pseudolycoriella hygida]|uniref:Uncharacterized protein n=1 Tax=Pseudolycoriella hygida TaxID=35572 RepID=A0A9Q0N0Z5_9DIPT|nr:hypothetical protein Bhyg_06570 [Pseudolycoriella hygida]
MWAITSSVPKHSCHVTISPLSVDIQKFVVPTGDRNSTHNTHINVVVGGCISPEGTFLCPKLQFTSKYNLERIYLDGLVSLKIL